MDLPRGYWEYDWHDGMEPLIIRIIEDESTRPLELDYIWVHDEERLERSAIREIEMDLCSAPALWECRDQGKLRRIGPAPDRQR